MQWENPSIAVASIYIIIVLVGIFLVIKLSKNKTKRVSSLRRFIQIASVFAVFMGLIIGPFNQPLWLPLGPSPRDRLVGADLLGNQFPDGLSVPILACYYPNGRTVTCAIWQIQAYIFPFVNSPRGYQVLYSTSGLEKLVIVFGSLIVMSLLLGRFFCGWLCTFGLYMEVLARVCKGFWRAHLEFSDETHTA